MLERPVGRTFRENQVRRFLKRDERGVASTVGTIMALLVFLTFLTLFTNSYIPIWMVDNERGHMNEVMDQFGGLKSDVDGMIINAEITGRTDLNMFAPITLGADGIPVFASPTAGLLTYSPYTGKNSSATVSFQYDISGIKNQMKDVGGGLVQLYAPNRYYVQQWVGYENGAILVKQLDGQAMRAYPSIDLQKPNLNSPITMAWTQVDMVGPNASVAGTGMAGINLDLIYFNSQTYNNGTIGTDQVRNNTITISLITQYGPAWYSYLNSYLKTNGNNLINNTDYRLSVPTQAMSDGPWTLTLKVFNVSYFTLNKALMQMTLQVS